MINSRGILAMAFSAHAGPVNIGNPDELSMLRLAEWILEPTGSSSEISFIDLPVDLPKVPSDPIARIRWNGTGTAALVWSESRTPVADPA